MQRPGGRQDLFEAILAPAIFVLPPLLAVLVVGAGPGLSEGLQRIHPVKACFNVAQWMAAAAAGSIVLRTWSASTPPRPRATCGRWSVAMAAISRSTWRRCCVVLLLTRRPAVAVSVLTELAPA